MKDPVRLLDDPEAPAAARELLRAARVAEPTAEQRDALWSAIAGAMGPGGPEGGPDGGGGEPGGPADGGGAIDPGPSLDVVGSLGPAAGGSVPAAVSSASSGSVAVGVATTSAAAVKGAGATMASAKVVGSGVTTWLGLVAAAGLSVGVAVVVGGPERPTPVESPAAIGARSVDDPASAERSRPDRRDPRGGEPGAAAAAVDLAAPTGTVPSIDDETAPSDLPGSAGPLGPARQHGGGNGSPAGPGRSTAAASAGSAEPRDASAAPAASTAREEVAVTTQARELIHGGQPARALEVLEAARVRFSGGVLVQERAALTVEALGRSGQLERAATLASAFLATWPNSAHAGLVRPWAR